METKEVIFQCYEYFSCYLQLVSKMSYFQNHGFIRNSFFPLYITIQGKTCITRTFIFSNQKTKLWANLCYMIRMYFHTYISIYFRYLVYVHSYLSRDKTYLSIRHNHGHWLIKFIYTWYTLYIFYKCTFTSFVFSTVLRFQTFIIKQISAKIVTSYFLW